MGFKKADKKRKKPLKILLFADAKVGKTHFALQSTPPVTVFDTENGTDLFEGKEGFDFSYWTYTDPKTKIEYKPGPSLRELRKCINALKSEDGRKNIKTFVLDNITDIWDSLQVQKMEVKEKKATERTYNKKSKNADITDIESFNTKDWGDMKKLYNSLMLELKNLPQNVIIIAREKELSEEDNKGNSKKSGVFSFSAEKNTHYAVDFILRLIYNESTGKRFAVVHGDRSGTYKKGKSIENPSFDVFDKIVNEMSDGEEVIRMSEKHDNVFEEELEDLPEDRVEYLKSLAKQVGEDAEKAVETALNTRRIPGTHDVLTPENLDSNLIDRLEKKVESLKVSE